MRNARLLFCLTGFLLCLGWPAIGDMFPLLFVAFVPLLFAEKIVTTQNKKPFVVFLYAYLGFILWNTGCIGWIYCVSEPFSTKVVSAAFTILANGLLMCIPIYLFHLILY